MGWPLSARELDVLRLLASDLDGLEIARELVSNRRAAIPRAEELEVVPPS